MDEAAYQKHLNRIIRRLRRYSKHVDVSLVEKAFDFAKEAHKDQLRKSGEPYFDHPVLVAKILTELKMDYVTVIGGLLHDVVEDTGYTLAEVQEQFSSEIAVLVDGVTKISELKFDSVEQRQAENFRKMILSMVNDVRVILIKFADRLHNMRTLDYLPPKKAILMLVLGWALVGAGRFLALLIGLVQVPFYGLLPQVVLLGIAAGLSHREEPG